MKEEFVKIMNQHYWSEISQEEAYNALLNLFSAVLQREQLKCDCGYNGEMEQNQMSGAVRCPNCQSVYVNI